MLKACEEQIGKTKLQQLPSDSSFQMEDAQEVLHEQEKIMRWPFQEHCWIRRLPMSREVRCGIYCEGIGFRNVKPNNHVMSPLEKILRILEENCGLLSSS